MCIAIFKPANKDITEATLAQCHKSNSDGCGFSFINHQGQLEIFKTMSFTKFMLAYNEALEQSPTSPFIIHFRIATHGTVNEFNCHPFRINEELTFIHNGVISWIDKCGDKLKSDTQMYNELVLQQLPSGWEENAGIRKLIEETIKGSKFVVLRRDGQHFIFNESAGVWDDGIWFSNYSYKTSRITHTNRDSKGRILPFHRTDDKWWNYRGSDWDYGSDPTGAYWQDGERYTYIGGLRHRWNKTEIKWELCPKEPMVPAIKEDTTCDLCNIDFGRSQTYICSLTDKEGDVIEKMNVCSVCLREYAEAGITFDTVTSYIRKV